MEQAAKISSRISSGSCGRNMDWMLVHSFLVPEVSEVGSVGVGTAPPSCNIHRNAHISMASDVEEIQSPTKEETALFGSWRDDCKSPTPK
jgi:hypothetical protein